MKFLEGGCLVGADRSLHDQKYHLMDVFGENGRNIVAHHAEDGSGMGSVIIASAYRLSFLPLCPGFRFPLLYLLFSRLFTISLIYSGANTH
ncbi:hypothetical protein B0H14DRAFT_2871691 [Mycena olivaceomarginata]|nr:hypothetical protein B0H14DRAFT_2871691 [Mycena olivaceomarginata]